MGLFLPRTVEIDGEQARIRNATIIGKRTGQSGTRVGSEPILTAPLD